MALTKRTDYKRKKVWIYGYYTFMAFFALVGSLNYLGFDISVSGDIQCFDECVSYFNITQSDFTMCFGSTFGGVYFDKPNVDHYLEIKIHQEEGRQYCTYRKEYLQWELVEDDLYYCPSSTKQDEFDKRYQRCDGLSESGKMCYRKGGDVWLPAEDLNSICLPYDNNEFRLTGYKNPRDSIEWGISRGLANVDPLWEGFSDKVTIDDKLKKKTVELGDFKMSAPENIQCVWGQDNKKHCEAIVEIENGLGSDYNFAKEKVASSFSRSVEELTYEVSTEFKNTTEYVVDFDCIAAESQKELTEEEMRFIDENSKDMSYLRKICGENITVKEWINWKEVKDLSSLNKIDAKSTVAVKVKFSDELWRKGKDKNSFNVSLGGSVFDMELDPDVDDCMVINASGNYTLNDTVSAGTSPCFDINVASVIFDCNGYTINGNSADVFDVGAYAGVKIQNCYVVDGSSAVYTSGPSGFELENFTSYSASSYGLELRSASSNILTNVFINTSSNYGIYWYDQSGGDIYNLSLYDCGSQNIRDYDSTGLDVYGIHTWGGTSGMTFRYPYSGSASIDVYNADSHDNTYGMVTEDIRGVNIYNSEFYNNTVYDIELGGSTADHCLHTFTNVNVTSESGGKDGVFYFDNTGAASYSDIYANHMIICNPDDGGVLDNLTIEGDATKKNNGLLIYQWNDFNVTNSNFTNNYIGIDFEGGTSTNYYIANNTFTGQGSYSIGLGSSGEVAYNTIYETMYLGGTHDVHDNTFITGTDYVIYERTTSSSTEVYNNIFNKSNGAPYVNSWSTGAGSWNTSQQVGSRIFGSGTDIGGNVYFATGGGYYYSCTDANLDGICDSSYDIGDTATEAIDYLALSDEYVPDYEYPYWIVGSNQTNDTTAGESILFSLAWHDDLQLSSYIFGWHNGANWTALNNSGDQEAGTQTFTADAGAGGGSGELFQGWEDGSWPEDDWAFDESDSGGGQTFSTTYSRTGTYGMLLDRSPSGSYTQNVIYTTYDFTGATSMTLDFYHWDQGDEDDGAQDHATLLASDVSYDEDGYYFTCDGTNWKALGALSGAASWTNINVVISDDPDWCGTADSNFAIKFMQYDDYPVTSDGRAFDDINITWDGGGAGTPDIDANKTAVEYTDVISGDVYSTINNVTFTVGVTAYNTSGSIANGNTNITLWLEVYNGTDWIEEGDFGVGSTQALQNYSITVTTQNILDTWQTEANRDFRISARYVDHNTTLNYSDSISWTYATAEMFSQQYWLNDSSVDFVAGDCTNASQVDCWSNVTHTITDTVGAIVYWYVEGMDTVGKTNMSDIFSLTTTSGGAANYTCDCPDPADNWVVPMNLNCELDVDCDIDGYNVSFDSTGNFYINATLTIDNMAEPITGQNVWMRSNGFINATG